MKKIWAYNRWEKAMNEYDNGTGPWPSDKRPEFPTKEEREKLHQLRQKIQEYRVSIGLSPETTYYTDHQMPYSRSYLNWNDYGVLWDNDVKDVVGDLLIIRDK